jgi:hypothetical protein
VASYSPVFSSQFILYTDETPNTQFAVPEGFTAVVREVDIRIADTLAGVTVGISTDAGAPTIWFTQLTVGVTYASAQWQGRVVCPSPGLIVLSEGSVGTGLTIYVGGYLLRNTLS